MRTLKIIEVILKDNLLHILISVLHFRMSYTVYSAFFYFLLHIVFDIFCELFPACVVSDIFCNLLFLYIALISVPE